MTETERLLREEFLAGLKRQLEEQFSCFQIDGRDFFEMHNNCTVFAPDLFPGECAIVIEYAESKKDAEWGTLEDGDVFYLEDYENMDDAIYSVLEEIAMGDCRVEMESGFYANRDLQAGTGEAVFDYSDLVKIHATGIVGEICDLPSDNGRGHYIVDAWFEVEQGEEYLFEVAPDEINLITDEVSFKIPYAKGLQREKSFKEKEYTYTEILRHAAIQLGKVFLEESGEGHDLMKEEYYAEDVFGWLCPENDVCKKDCYYRCAEWRTRGDELIIDFVKYPIYHDDVEEQL